MSSYGAPPGELLRIDGQRLWRSLMEMAEIGATPDGGCCRLALTDEDEAALELFERWARDQGLKITRDRIGNCFAERPGTEASRPAILVGSHLDTQPTGGRFDGAYGTLAALEVIRTLDDHDVQTIAPITAVSWTNEEGARFPQPCTGSGVFAGAIQMEKAMSQCAGDGRTFEAEIGRLGRAGSEKVGQREFAAYFEAHIEQGPILESTGNTIGVVTRGQGVRGVIVRLTGSEAHTGTTPMDSRRDALVAAARIVADVRRLPLRHGGALATVSDLRVGPGSRSVIPGRAEMVVDLRHPEPGALDELEAEFLRQVAETAAHAKVDVEVVTFLDFPPVVFDQSSVDSIRTAALRLQYPTMDLASGAGHDAFYIARRVPAAMVFIPCRDGISHSPMEYAAPEDVQAGADVLLHAVMEKAGTSETTA